MWYNWNNTICSLIPRKQGLEPDISEQDSHSIYLDVQFEGFDFNNLNWFMEINKYQYLDRCQFSNNLNSHIS